MRVSIGNDNNDCPHGVTGSNLADVRPDHVGDHRLLRNNAMTTSVGSVWCMRFCAHHQGINKSTANTYVICSYKDESKVVEPDASSPPGATMEQLFDPYEEKE